MQHIDGISDLHRVDRPVCTAQVVFHHLQHAGAPETLERLGLIVLLACLRQCSANPKTSMTLSGMASRSFFEDPTQCKGLN